MSELPSGKLRVERPAPDVVFLVGPAGPPTTVVDRPRHAPSAARPPAALTSANATPGPLPGDHGEGQRTSGCAEAIGRAGGSFGRERC